MSDKTDRPETLEELHDEWREKADELIHEGENEYIEGRGGQLAYCALQLERFIDRDDDREDAEWVKESVIKDARENDSIVVSGAWAASPVEGKDKVDVFRFDHSLRKEVDDAE